jgi:hypothetical protein
LLLLARKVFIPWKLISHNTPSKSMASLKWR